MLNSLPHTVHLIIDERSIKMTLNPTDITYLEANVPPNQGAVVMVVEASGLPYKKLVQNVGKSMAPKAFRQPFFAATVEEARAILQDLFAVRYP